MKCVTLFRRDEHRWLAFGQDPNKPENIIDTNQYVICRGNSAMILDPGGMEVFPPMLAALTHEVPVEDVRMLFFSHQDPDVGSSLPLWRRVCRSDVKVYLSWMWSGFVAHFDREAQLTPIPDEGMEVSLADLKLRFIPAHYMHSPGNYNVYDPQARILFSGDIGAALLPNSSRGQLFVQDFNSHVQYMDQFHRRWIGSSRARDAWINTVSKLDIDILAPQHGQVFKGDDVKRFLDWLSKLEVGSGIGSMSR